MFSINNFKTRSITRIVYDNDSKEKKLCQAVYGKLRYWITENKTIAKSQGSQVSCLPKKTKLGLEKTSCLPLDYSFQIAYTSDC